MAFMTINRFYVWYGHIRSMPLCVCLVYLQCPIRYVQTEDEIKVLISSTRRFTTATEILPAVLFISLEPSLSFTPNPSFFPVVPLRNMFFHTGVMSHICPDYGRTFIQSFKSRSWLPSWEQFQTEGEVYVCTLYMYTKWDVLKGYSNRRGGLCMYFFTCILNETGYSNIPVLSSMDKQTC